MSISILYRQCFMHLDVPFARLPLRLDAERLRAEVEQFAWFEWVPYHYFSSDYRSIELVSSLGRSMDLPIAPFLPTPHLARCPYIAQVLGAVPGVLYEARLRRLGPGARITRHHDGRFDCRNRPRVHIAISTSDRAMFVVGDERIHMGTGEAWVFDRHSYHAVENEGGGDRIHLTIDLTPDQEFLDLVASAYRPSRAPGGRDAAPRAVAYAPGALVDLRTERMADGAGNSPAEIDVMASALVRWMRRNRIEDEARARAVERELERFRIGWRCLWAEFGRTRAGWPAYLALGKTTVERLHEIERVGDRALLRDDVPVWLRLRDYLSSGPFSHHGVPSVIPDAVVPDLGERFLVPDALFRLAGSAVEVFLPGRAEFVGIEPWQLILLAYIASHERLPDGTGGDTARRAIEQLLEWQLLLPQASAPRPAWRFDLSELGAGGAPADASSREALPAEDAVGPTTRLRLVGGEPHYARLRWRGYDGGTQLLWLRPDGHIPLEAEALSSLLHFTSAISLAELAERIGEEFDDGTLAAIRSLVRLGVLEPATAASAGDRARTAGPR